MTLPARLRWRCRRGTRELDVLLERFAEARYAGLDPGARAVFERLLDTEDDRLIDWLITGRERPDDDALARLVTDIRRIAGF
jgi:antitoxin CptB